MLGGALLSLVFLELPLPHVDDAPCKVAHLGSRVPAQVPHADANACGFEACTSDWHGRQSLEHSQDCLVVTCLNCSIDPVLELGKIFLPEVKRRCHTN